MHEIESTIRLGRQHRKLHSLSDNFKRKPNDVNWLINKQSSDEKMGIYGQKINHRYVSRRLSGDRSLNPQRNLSWKDSRINMSNFEEYAFVIKGQEHQPNIWCINMIKMQGKQLKPLYTLWSSQQKYHEHNQRVSVTLIAIWSNDEP